ncbi:MAG: glycoside hydrolase family 2 protein [Spirochaetaceae bacterium]|nr:glycoside hydrolase family 2 protein [Spirochaetaceae bacterium]
MKVMDLSSTWALNVVVHENTPTEAKNLPADIPMQVPGDIAAALLQEGHISDPFYGRNELDTLWLGKTDWMLTTYFNIEAEDYSLAETQTILDFPVVDTIVEILLNGKVVGRGRNMFRPIRLDTTEKIRSGENRLDVIIRSPEADTAAAAESLPYPIPHTNQFPWQWHHRNLLRKVACHGGWDWGITLMTGGIYEPPAVLVGGDGRIESVTTRQERLPGPNGSRWALTVRCDYISRADREVNLEYEFDGKREAKLFAVQSGENRLEHVIEVDNPQLWWPAGQGDQFLYTLAVESPDERIEKRVGFRTVEVISEDDEVGRSMGFRVNGRDIFAKGANWIPVDAFPSRQTKEVYRRLLEDAVEANMNMLRLWGGGQYEKDVFYDICDEMGIMVWHDMMFSCSLYPADKDFLADVDAEIRHQVRRLKHHPSIVLWCGNNEDLGALNWFPESRENRDRYVVDYDRLNEGVVGRVVRELDPDRTWWPSSPSAGEGDYSDCWHDDTKGDMHYWSVWHEGKDFESFYDIAPRFCSEFGFQSFPSIKTVTSFAPENQRNLTSPVMRHHQKNNAGNTIILSTMARYFRMPVGLENQLYLSQVQQAWAIKTAVEYWRSQRPVSMGALFWQLNDNWPVASWSSIEYDGTWKLLHYEAKRFFAPVWVSLYKKDGILRASALNDTPNSARGRAFIRLLSFDGSELESWEMDDLRCPAGCASEFFSHPLAELQEKSARRFDVGMTPHDVDKADVVDDGLRDRFVVAEWHRRPAATPVVTTLFLTEPRDCELADAEITLISGEESGTLRLETDLPAFFVQPECDMPGRFDDAGFTLLPGHPRTLRFLSNGESLPGSQLVKHTKVRHLRMSYGPEC